MCNIDKNRSERKKGILYRLRVSSRLNTFFVRYMAYLDFRCMASDAIITEMLIILNECYICIQFMPLYTIWVIVYTCAYCIHVYIMLLCIHVYWMYFCIHVCRMWNCIHVYVDTCMVKSRKTKCQIVYMYACNTIVYKTQNDHIVYMYTSKLVWNKFFLKL